MQRLCGLETEYGIQVDEDESMDVVVESMELIRCYVRQDFVALWNYALENPRLDMRGFEVSELLNDKDETVHLQKDRRRRDPARGPEKRSNRPQRRSPVQRPHPP